MVLNVVWMECETNLPMSTSQVKSHLCVLFDWFLAGCIHSVFYE